MVVAALIAVVVIGVVVGHRAASTASNSATASHVPAAGNSEPPPGTTISAPASGPAPVIAAAGDIACNSPSQTTGHKCQQGLTAAEIATDPKLAAVLALGDLQYECGDYAYLERYYGTTWG